MLCNPEVHTQKKKKSVQLENHRRSSPAGTSEREPHRVVTRDPTSCSHMISRIQGTKSSNVLQLLVSVTLCSHRSSKSRPYTVQSTPCPLRRPEKQQRVCAPSLSTQWQNEIKARQLRPEMESHSV